MIPAGARHLVAEVLAVDTEVTEDGRPVATGLLVSVEHEGFHFPFRLPVVAVELPDVGDLLPAWALRVDGRLMFRVQLPGAEVDVEAEP